MILEFYENKGHRIFIFLIIGFILFLTMLGFAYEYVSIHKSVDEVYKIHGIAKNGEQIPVVKSAYNGQIEYIEGSVEVREDTDSGWFGADKSQIIKTGNEIRTLNNSRAIITIEDGSSVRLDENTHVVFNGEMPNIAILMEGGSVYNKVAKNNDRKYVVQAGEYIVTARGTEFGVEKGYDSVGVMVTESAVDIANSSGKKIDEVAEGGKAIVQNDIVKKSDIAKEDLEESFIAWSVSEKTEQKSDEVSEDKKEEKDEEEEVDVSGSIVLSGAESSSGVRLHWDVANVSAPHGFKIVKSKEKNPVYPGDEYVYLSDSGTRDYKWKIDTGKEYYFRVCVYNGNGKCLLYSNNVFLDTPKKEEDKEDDSDDYADKITLKADEDDGDVELEWDISGGDAPKGFKIVKSKEKNPVYPGDDYKYISDGDEDEYTWKGFKEGKTYYFRVCVYKGGKCGAYSNNVKVEF